MRRGVLLAVVLAGLCAAGASVWTMGSEAIARAPQQELGLPAGLPVDRVLLREEGEPDLAGWVARGAGNCGTIVLLHGRGSSKQAMVPRASLLFDAGYSIVLFDLSGHGESGGSVRGFGYTEGKDAARVLAFAHARFPGARVGAVGSSLGAAALVFAAQEAGADAYVLEQLYASLRETTALRMPLPLLRDFQADVLLAQMWPRLGFRADAVRPVDRIGKIAAPLLLLAGSADPFVDRGQTAALKDAAPGGTGLVWFDGAGHVDLFRRDARLYRDAVLPFLARSLCPEEGGGHA